MSSVEDLIKNSLYEIGYVSAEQTLSDDDKAFCLSRLNRMIDSWKTQRRFVYAIEAKEYPWGVSQQSYTIGPTGDFVLATGRPVKIEDHCNLIIVGTTNVRVPLPLINVEQYSAIGIPTLSSGIPIKVYYQPTYPNGTLYPWPYPTDVANILELFIWEQVNKFSGLTETLNLPPGYEEAITQSLAELLCVPFGRAIEPDLRQSARDARHNIANVNTTAPTQQTDYVSSPGGGMQWDGAIRGWR